MSVFEAVREATRAERERNLDIVEACRTCPHRAAAFIASGLSPREIRQQLAIEGEQAAKPPRGFSGPAPAADWNTIAEAARQAGRLH